MVLNKKPVEKNRNILNRKGRKNIVPSVAEAWVQSEDFSAGRPLLPCPASPERLLTADRRWSKVDEAGKEADIRYVDNYTDLTRSETLSILRHRWVSKIFYKYSESSTICEW